MANKRKLFFIITTAVLLIVAACEGSFVDPNMQGGAGSGGISGGGGSGGSGGSGGGGSGSGSNNNDSGGSGGGSGTSGTFTLTGIPSKYDGMYAVCWFTGAYGRVWGSQSPSSYNSSTYITTVTGIKISNGRVSLPLWGSSTQYSGNDKTNVFVEIHSTQTIRANSTDKSRQVDGMFSNVTFSNGGASKTWNDTDWQEDVYYSWLNGIRHRYMMADAVIQINQRRRFV
jgi:hypothetical protein